MIRSCLSFSLASFSARSCASLKENGGYEYAKQFYEEAFHFIEEKFGADNVISAVMHADEINLAATEDLGKEVYHYHLHAMVLPVVEVILFRPVPSALIVPYRLGKSVF